MDQFAYGTIAEIAKGIRAKNVSPVEIVDAHLARIAKFQPKLKAFVHLDEKGVRKQARAQEAAVLRGEALGPLHGVPVSIKSCIDVAGWPTPAGSALRRDCLPQHDAPLVARLRRAGAIMLGNTNTPEFLMNYETNNLLLGKTSNPWNLERSAGGSSGGEAAAIASGCSAAGIGSDGGGSVRVPAHFCGICGLKPTPGRIPATGHFPASGGAFAWIGVVGPMARTIAEVRALFEVIAGPDAGDALSAPVPVGTKEKHDSRKVRIGILESEALRTAIPETQTAVQRAAKMLSDQGFIVEPQKITGLDQAIALWWFFFGPVIGHLLRQIVAGHENSISPMLREYLAVTQAGPPLTLDVFLTACMERDALRADLLRQMEETPILISPVSSRPAFRHGEGTWRTGAEESYRDTMRFSQWLNLAGLPGASVPAGFSAEGLPIGVQVVGRPYEEELVLEITEAIEQARGPWQAPPLSV